jgi:hypothetical protein|tara:strand:- start:1190 stop:2038 length:849 start_codon:yes stop_codon:yes gene_type:complete
MRQIVIISMLVVSSFLLAGCVVSVGGEGVGLFDGERIEDSRHIENVGEVVMAARGSLHITQGESESLRMEGRKSAVDDLKIYQRGDVLIIDNRIDFDFPLITWSRPDKVDIYLSVKSIDAITLKGHGDIDMRKLKAENMHLDLTGHGDMHLGNIVADSLFVTLHGHGDIRLDEVVAQRVETELEGHGDIHIDYLDAEKVGIDIEGHGEIRMAGKTVLQRIDIDGHGDYYGDGLASRETDVTVQGHGSAEVWARDVLSMDVDRHATVNYRGDPEVYYLGDDVK